MQQTFLALLALVATISATNLQTRETYEKAFFDHIKTYQLTFKDGAEFTHRLNIFANMLDMINTHNADPTQTYKLGLNQFSHLTFDEFKDAVHIGGARPPFLRKKSPSVHQAPKDLKSLPAEVDWVKSSAVTDVKNQGNCGSCWSFSTTGAIEGAYYLKYGELKSFSEQDLVSCDTSGQDAGCNGGWMDDAFTFVKAQGGLPTEDQYPYTSGDSGKSGSCDATLAAVKDAKAAPQSYTDVTTGDVNALMSAVAQQPVSIAIQANQLAFQSYKSGVLTGRCGNRLDHGVLLVGYGTDPEGGDYWKVKNSWGSTWGEGGYIRIERSDKDLCGVLDAPSYPNL